MIISLKKKSIAMIKKKSKKRENTREDKNQWEKKRMKDKNEDNTTQHKP